MGRGVLLILTYAGWGQSMEQYIGRLTSGWITRSRGISCGRIIWIERIRKQSERGKKRERAGRVEPSEALRVRPGHETADEPRGRVGMCRSSDGCSEM